jgi:CubicO group peptidase (beta-lactamase class C family)
LRYSPCASERISPFSALTKDETMKTMDTVLAAALLLAFPLASNAAEPVAAEAAAASHEQQVDALFAKWNKPDAPGAAVEIIRDGKVVLRKGYGMADIERGVPIASQTVFNVGSTSKQFTAFSIHLLAQEGKLSIDDDMRKYLPQMPDFGKTITIRNLLHHTSGLRDSSNLMFLAGWRPGDITTPDDMLDMIRHQRELNFAPGSEHLYSNAGYIVLAAIVERVSGKPLSLFAKERIFDPLGMKHTHFQADYGDLVHGRALSYLPASGGAYKYMSVARSGPGPSELLTTVEDLALWDQNFYDGRVGGKDLLAKMEVIGVLNSGESFNYASGLYVEAYRGAKLVEHSGSVGGYASQMSRFTGQHFTVVVLANSPNVSPTSMTRRIADIYLDHELAPKPVAAAKQSPPEVKLEQAKLDAVASYYALSPEFGVNFTVEDGRLMAQGTGQGKVPLFASGDREFFAKVVDAQFSFDAPGKDGVVARFVLHQNGMDQPGLRTSKPSLSDAAMRAFEGEYYSDELRVLYTVGRKDGKLVMTYPRGDLPLNFTGGSTFSSGGPVGEVTFECAHQARCTGFKVNGARVRDIRFTKVAIVAPGARATADTGVFLKPDTATVAKAAACPSPGNCR